MYKNIMEFKGKTPTPKKSNYHYKNLSFQKYNQSKKNTISLPPIYTKNQPKKSPQKRYNISNISSILNPIQKPKIKYINSFSDARLPDEFYDLSYDNPQN